RSRPFDEDAEGEPVERSVAVTTLLDVPKPTAFAEPSRRQSVEVAWAAVVAVAGDEDRPLELPAGYHLGFRGWNPKPSRARPPRLLEPLDEQCAGAHDPDPLLLQRVAVADRDRAVLERLLVDRQRPWRPDLVLAAVALA